MLCVRIDGVIYNTIVVTLDEYSTIIIVQNVITWDGVMIRTPLIYTILLVVRNVVIWDGVATGKTEVYAIKEFGWSYVIAKYVIIIWRLA